MSEKEPVAFLSYVRADDEHDAGRITELRQRLEGEVKMQTGRPFHVFQDRNDIRWGQQWKERIEDALLGVTFLIPIVTPSFFQSRACRDEFEKFMLRERQLGENHLILPIYYVESDAIASGESGKDEIADILRARHWADWRDFRFDPLDTPRLRSALANLARDIRTAMNRLELVITAAQAEPTLQVNPKQGAVEQIAVDAEGSYDADIPALFEQPQSDMTEEAPTRRSYYAYTKEFDEVVEAGELVEAVEAVRLHTHLLGIIRDKLGMLDSNVVFSFSPEVRRYAAEAEVCISILIDNSGSMRGHPIQAVASWTSVVSRLLSEINIPNEVLGFTTRAWKGGQARELWLRNGRQELPGRLNDLRHIVYKSFAQTFQEADINLAVMMKSDLLKENIDGEALLWAHSRISKRKSRRKILLVLSDGAPVDDSTLSVNPAGFLERHLVETINWLRVEKGIEVYGVGLGHDVGRYYGVGPVLNVQNLGPEFLHVVASAILGKWADTARIRPPADVETKPRARKRLPKSKA